MSSKNKLFSYLARAVLILLAFFVLPDIFSKREEKAFSDLQRLEEAKKKYHIEKVADSVFLIPGEFYSRGWLIRFILGNALRDLWQQRIKVPVLKFETAAGGLAPFEFSGGRQTIGIKVRDTAGRIWSVRSVNKDQSAALPQFWRGSILRPMFRDQACALNPYGTLAAAKLAQAAEIHSSDARLYLFPYDPKLGKYNSRMAGRLVMLLKPGEPDLNKFRHDSLALISTEEMLKKAQANFLQIDTALYLRSRLFDILISDWDRHEGNWKWLVKLHGKTRVAEPLASDRDMAFYTFGDGLINRFTLLLVKRFQSFTPKYKSIEGLMQQSITLDTMILGRSEKRQFIKEAEFIKARLNSKTVQNAFQSYPDAAYALAGAAHKKILMERLRRLPKAAEEFYELIKQAQP